MNRILFALLLLVGSCTAVHAQVVYTTPTFPAQTDSITVFFDASKGNRALAGYIGDVYAHTGVITFLSTSPTDWRFVKATWTTNLPECKLTRVAKDVYALKINNPRAFYGVTGTEVVRQLAFVFRSSDGNIVGRAENGTDIYVELYSPGTYLRVLAPLASERVVDSGKVVTIKAIASDNVPMMQINADNKEIAKVQNDTISVDYTVVRTTKIEVLTYNTLGGAIRDTFTMRVRPRPRVIALPAGVKDGINIVNDTTAIVVLYAPKKQEVYVVGPFTSWQRTDEFYCNVTPDNQRWWKQIPIDRKGQTMFQWSFDDDRRISDPYAWQLCDPNDRFIESWRFPNLPSYPTGKTQGIVSVINTALEPYSWRTINFKRPNRDNMVVYELLVRDFTDKSSFQGVIDSLDYLQRLGVTAIELMPVTEFEGNDSWGYNPSHLFAVDKYYGTENDLKRLVDEAHARGIAVILDIVLNHQFGQSPLVNLWGSVSGPTTENPYFNVTPTHPFNVGYDMNHESLATREYSIRFLQHWIREFKIDGYRYDLSKGLTQFFSGSDASLMSKYDASRIAILKRYMAATREVDPAFINILEHFADNNEEQELSKDGAIMWANANYAGSQAVMSFSNNDIASSMSAQRRGFTRHGLVGYVESHDEERTIFRAVNYGKVEAGHSTKDTAVALKRLEALMVATLCVPGPKMLWQFNEIGYPYNIDLNGRLGRKPLAWPLLRDQRRMSVFQAVADLSAARKVYTCFSTLTATLQTGDLVKTILLKDPTCDLLYVGNFDVVPKTVNLPFTKKGTWYDYTGKRLYNVYLDNNSTTIQPGEYRLYTTQPVSGLITRVADEAEQNDSQFYAFPQPASDELSLRLPGGAGELRIIDALGRTIEFINVTEFDAKNITLDASCLNNGSYMAVFTTSTQKHITSFVIQK